MPRGGDDVLVTVARAGRERGTGALYCTQRVKGIPIQLIEHLSRLYLFSFDVGADVKFLYSCGLPEGTAAPEQDHAFRYWTKADRKTVWGPYVLDAAWVRAVGA